MKIVLFLFTLCALLQLSVSEFTISTTTVSEDAGAVRFTIQFRPKVNWMFFLQVSTAPGTARAGVDYTHVKKLLTGRYPANTIVFTVPIIDNSVEGPVSKSFTIRIESNTGVNDPIRSFLINIMDNDVVVSPVAVSADVTTTLDESIGGVDVIFRRDDGSSHAFDFQFMFVDVNTNNDIVSTTGTVNFIKDQDFLTVTAIVTVVNDKVAENDETFNMVLSGNDIVDTTIVFTIKDDDTPVYHHCRRLSQECFNDGDCNAMNGECQCADDTYQGDMCEIESAKVDGSGCPLEGCNNGVCVQGPICKCNPGWTGTLCDKKSIYLQCNAKDFGICITPYNIAGFTGKIFVVGQETVPECNLALITTMTTGIPDWCDGYGAVVTYLDGPCSQPSTAETVDGNLMYTVDVRVQYDPAASAKSDETVKFRCQYDSSGIFMTSGSVFSLSGTAIDGTPNGATGNISPVIQTLRNSDGSTADGDVEIGEILTVCVTVDADDTYNSVEVLTITLDNNLEDPNDPNYYKSEVFDSGCKSTSNNYLVTRPHFQPTTSKHTQCYQFEVIAFVIDNRDQKYLRVYTKVQGFAESNAAKVPTCSIRKKRQAGNSSNSTTELQSVIRLILPESVRLQNTDSACAKEWVMSAMIGVSIVSITMAVIIAILIFAVVRKFKGKEMA